MADGRPFWRLLALPPDLAVVVTLVLLVDAFVLLPVPGGTAVRAVLAFPLLLFLPGYALVAAMYPEGVGQSAVRDGIVFPAVENEDDEFDPLSSRQPSGVERFVLSVGLSVAAVALTGLALNHTPWGIRLVPIVTSVTGLTLAATVVATLRRRALTEEERFSVPFRRFVSGVRTGVFAPATRKDAALNVLLAAAVLLAASSVVYAVAYQEPDDGFSELYLLTPGEDGELLADDFPTTLPPGEPTELVVGVGNHEHEPVEYTVVGELQRVRAAGNETTVVEAEPVDRFGVSLGHNESELRTVSVEPGLSGEPLRLVFLLYRGDPPPDPSMETAYRSTYLWVDVGEG